MSNNCSNNPSPRGGGGGGVHSPIIKPRSLSMDSTSTGSAVAENAAEWLEKANMALDNPFKAHDEMIKKFVITGGPCSGKTTAMGRLTEFLQDKGFRVFVAIEAATVVWRNGVSPAD